MAAACPDDCSTPQPSKLKCVFCSIAHGAESARVLYEDDRVLAFRDIKPVAQQHVLVVPKEHVVDANQLTLEHSALVEV